MRVGTFFFRSQVIFQMSPSWPLARESPVSLSSEFVVLCVCKEVFPANLETSAFSWFLRH